MEQVFEQKLMQATQAVEAQVRTFIRTKQSIERVFIQLDAELNRLEKLSENDIEKMRAQRLESLKQEHKKRQEWLANGTDKQALSAPPHLSFPCSRSW